MTTRLLSILPTLTILLLTYAQAAMARKTLFDDGWKFFLGDDSTALRTDFDDNKWQKITIPHDWSIYGKFDKDAPAGNDGGYLPTGTGWYRKTFLAGNYTKDKKIQLYFEGVYMDSEVYINGKKAGGHPYGFTSFFCDITPYIKKGKNVVAVRVDNSKQKNCRWYTGSGIYRHVWLVKTNKTHIDNWGIQIICSDNGNGKWNVTIDTKIEKEYTSCAESQIIHTLYNKDGVAIATSTGHDSKQTITVDNPILWSTDNPYLYKVRTRLIVNGTTMDEENNSIGFRTITYDSTNGLKLNSKSIVLNGGCVHHDNGILGAASFNRAEYRKVELLKKAGFNAVRTSHNIPSEAFLNACDELGLLVIDEAFDGWREQKNPHDYSTLIDKWWKTDLGTMVMRDRNHPSIFCWSIGNEVIERKKIEIVKTAHNMAALCRQLDPTRPVTSALAAWDNDWDIYDPLAAEHDIVGYNYMIHKSESDHERVPNRIMIQTESYPRDAYRNYIKTTAYPYIIGDFVWTAIDYIGESGIGRWYYDGDVPGEHYSRPLYPWHAAYCGDIDMTGLRKPISHYRSMLYNTDGEKLYMAVREPDGYNGKIMETSWSVWPTWESWNWNGHEGKEIEVEVYSKYPTVRLLLNGKIIETKQVKESRTVFKIKYHPGILKAEAIDNKEVKEAVSLKTTGKACKLRLTADRTDINADGEDLSFVTVEALDSEGNIVTDANCQFSASITGQASIIAIGNADIKDDDPYYDTTHHTWKGRALIVVKSGSRKGNAALYVNSKDLKTEALKLKITAIKSNQ